MTDKALANAERRKSELEQQVTEWMQMISAAKKELDQLHDWIEIYHALSGSESPERLPQKANKAAESAVKNSPRDDVAKVVTAILEAEQRPIARSELFKKVLERPGIVITGKDPEMVFSTMLWRMQDRFVRIPKRGYWLVDRPLEGVYRPGQYSSKPDNIPAFIS